MCFFQARDLNCPFFQVDESHYEMFAHQEAVAPEYGLVQHQNCPINGQKKYFILIAFSNEDASYLEVMWSLSSKENGTQTQDFLKGHFAFIVLLCSTYPFHTQNMNQALGNKVHNLPHSPYLINTYKEKKNTFKKFGLIKHHHHVVILSQKKRKGASRKIWQDAE